MKSLNNCLTDLSSHLRQRPYFLALIHSSLLLVLVSPVIFRAFFQLDHGFDFLAYHLPFALQYFDLTTYGSPLEVAKSGFPPLANWFQGLLVFLTGRISMANCTNLLAYIFALIFLKKRLIPHLSLPWFISFSLSIPMIVLHLSSGYIDLWSNIWLFLAVISLLRWIESSKNSHAIYLCVFSLLASLSKMQTWPILAILGIVASFFARKKNIQSTLNKKAASIFLFSFFLIVSVFPLKNTLQHGNPTHPFPPPIVSKFVKIDALKSLDGAYANQKPKQLEHLPQPLLFFVSFFELNRILDPQTKMRWSHDQWSPDRNMHFRMGGYFVLSALGLFVLFVLGIRIKAFSFTWGAIFLLLFLLTSFIPQSHEMRYYLYLPLLLCTFATLSLQKLKPPRWLSLMIFLTCCLVTHKTAKPYRFSVKSIEAMARPAALHFWKEEGKQYNQPPHKCIDVRYDQGIFYSGPDFNTYYVRNKCSNP